MNGAGVVPIGTPGRRADSVSSKEKCRWIRSRCCVSLDCITHLTRRVRVEPTAAWLVALGVSLQQRDLRYRPRSFTQNHFAERPTVRTLYLNTAPPSLQGDVITPNFNAAARYGVEYRSLEHLAIATIGQDRIASPLLSHHLLRRAIRETIDPDDAEGTARALAPAIRELLRADADLDVLTETGRREARLAEATRRYRELLRDHGKIERAEVFVAARKGVTTQQLISVVGFPRFGREEIRFLDAIAASGSCLELHHAEDYAFADPQMVREHLEGAGWQVVVGDTLLPWQSDVAATALRFPDREAEVRGALRHVKVLLESGVPAGDIALATRDEVGYGPLVLAVAREYEIPIAAFYAIPVTATRVGSWLQALLDVFHDDFDYEATARYLAHPLTDRLPSEVWARARAQHPQNHAGWRAVGADLADLEWPERAAAAFWGGRLHALFDALVGRVEDPRGRVALAQIREAVGPMIGPDDPELHRNRVLALLRDALELLTVPVQPEGGVALHTPLSLFGTKRPYLWVLGMAEGVTPPALRDDPVLDYLARKRLAAGGVLLESAVEAAARERLSFWALIRTASSEITYSYPHHDGRDPVEPSHFLELLGLEVRRPEEEIAVGRLEARRAGLLQPDVYNDDVLVHARAAYQVELAREVESRLGPHDGMTGIPFAREGFSYSATQMQNLMACPFQWFARYALQATEAEEHEDDPLFLGRLYHGALELAAERAKGAPDVRQAMLEHLDDAFAAAEQRENLPAMPGWEARRAHYLQTLEAAVAGPAFALAGAGIHGVELTFSEQWRGFPVAGKIDRLDEHPDGLVITDYKSGVSVSAPDVQLPMYQEVIQGRFPEREVADTRYLSIRTGEVIEASPPDDLDAMLDEVRRHLEEGRFPLDLTQKACERCGFDLVCRRGPRLARKEPA